LVLQTEFNKMKRTLLLVLLMGLFSVFAGCELALDETTEEDIADFIQEPEAPPEQPDPSPEPPPANDPGTVVPTGDVLVNPAISEGVGMDQHAYWKVYANTYNGRDVTIRWPTDLYTVYGCRPENTRCEADGTVFSFYAIDTGDSGKAAKLSYGCNRKANTFPRGVIAILYKDGEPLAAFSVADPTKGLYLRLPPTQQLP